MVPYVLEPDISWTHKQDRQHYKMAKIQSKHNYIY